MLIYGLLILPFVIVGALLLLQRPLRVLYLFIFLLPFHSLILTILLAQVGLPVEALKLVASWKETLLIATFLIVVFRTLFESRPVRFIWLDGVAAIWLVQVLMYFFFYSATIVGQDDWILRFYGARDWLLYLFPYFIGRLIPVSEKNADKVLRAVLLVGVVTSLAGIIEYFLVPTDWHVALGVPRYFGEFLNLPYPDYLSGLPPNYWAEIAGYNVRRSVSVYLSSQGFALPFLIIFPVALYNWIVKLTKHRLLILSTCGFALVLTLTRMTIVVCFFQALLLLLLFRKQKAFLNLVLVIFVVSGIVLLTSPSIRAFVVNTLTLQDSSSSIRPQQWIDGLRTLLENPLGKGLGTTGQTGAQFGVGGEGSEAGYFKVTGALGLPGVFLFLSWFAGILIYGYTGWRRLSGAWQGIAVLTLITAVGFLLNNLTAPPDQSPFVIYIFGWLAGLTVQLATRRSLAGISQIDRSVLKFNKQHPPAIVI